MGLLKKSYNEKREPILEMHAIQGEDIIEGENHYFWSDCW